MNSPTLTLALTLSGAVAFAQEGTFVHTTGGGHQIILLSEGQRQGQANVLVGATPEVLASTMPDGTYPGATNAFLVRTASGKNVLVDAGYGRELFANLQRHGVTADMVDAVLLTHMHGDHIGGLLNGSGERSFPNAQLYLAKPEHDHYAGGAEGKGQGQARAVISAYREQLVLFAPEQGELIAGAITPLPAYGHTPGHTAYLVDAVLIWGDLTHAMAVQMPYPAVAVTYDTDSRQAVDTRLRLLQHIVEHRLTVAGMHIPYPGMGTLAPNGSGGYTFTPLK